MAAAVIFAGGEGVAFVKGKTPGFSYASKIKNRLGRRAEQRRVRIFLAFFVEKRGKNRSLLLLKFHTVVYVTVKKG